MSIGPINSSFFVDENFHHFAFQWHDYVHRITKKIIIIIIHIYVYKYYIYIFSVSAYNIANIIFWLLNCNQHNRKWYNFRAYSVHVISCTITHTIPFQNPYSYSLFHSSLDSLCASVTHSPSLFIYPRPCCSSLLQHITFNVIYSGHFATIFRLIKFQSTEFAHSYTHNHTKCLSHNQIYNIINA